jgi:hypothetical protein
MPLRGSSPSKHPSIGAAALQEIYAVPHMARTELSRRVEKVVGYPPLCDMSDQQRREVHEALLDADTFEDLPGKWQAAVLKAEQSRPKLRVVSDL